MSFFTTIENDLSAVKKWFEGNPIVQTIEADFHAAAAELAKITASDLENAVKVVGLRILSAYATGNASAAIEAGIAVAITEFKAIGADISAKSVRTLVTTIVNQVEAATTPAPVVAP